MKIKRMIMNFMVNGVLPVIWVIFLISTINSIIGTDYPMAITKTLFLFLFFIGIIILQKRVKEGGNRS